MLSLMCFGSCRNTKQASKSTNEPEDIGSPTWPDRMPRQLDFRKHVRPILVINCVECHNAKDAPEVYGTQSAN